MPDVVYDVAIVGYGPAGITAAIYAARKRLRCVLVGELPGGEVRNSGDIENWPGDGKTDGIALAEKLQQHLNVYREYITVYEEKVSRIAKGSDNLFALTTATQELHSRTVIYTAGRHPRLLEVAGEVEFKNRGVTYCATCDAPLFPDKTVAVIGGGNTGAEAVIMLQKIAQKIYVLQASDALTADPVLVENFKNDPKVSILYQAKISAIRGDLMVNELDYTDSSGETQTLHVQGIFVAIGAIPNTEPVKELVALDKFGAVAADRYGVTNVPGFFAAGDVTDIRDAQIVVAAGHGCSAALSAGDYLSRHAE